MKKILCLSLLVMLVLYAAPAQAEKKIVFGEKKGQVVKDTNVVTMENAESQTKLLQETLTELQKQTKLLEEQNVLLKKADEDRQKSIIAILKGIDALMAKHQDVPAKPNPALR